MASDVSRMRRKHLDGIEATSVSESSSFASNELLEQKILMVKSRQNLVLWRAPLKTLYYFVLELCILLRHYSYKLLQWKKLLIFIAAFTLLCVSACALQGPHQEHILRIQKKVLWCAYWVGLGILSSVGLGTGLHTFLLYLGPHIAAVTLAAFECMSIDFPEPPYPDDIICPDIENSSMSVWTIMGKVRVEAFMWGAGTAIGELPPYFMARASRLSGEVDPAEQELELLMDEQHRHATDLGILSKTKLVVHSMIQKVGFFGILVCASIPNPLFDLAGITCGHFLVPFWRFFGATLIGKAIIKMHIQKIFVIFVFSEHHVEQVVNMLTYIPRFGSALQAPFKEYLVKQKTKLHHKRGTSVHQETSWLSWMYEQLVVVMVLYFVISIVNSMAQSYHKRMTQSLLYTTTTTRSE